MPRCARAPLKGWSSSEGAEGLEMWACLILNVPSLNSPLLSTFCFTEGGSGVHAGGSKRRQQGCRRLGVCWVGRLYFVEACFEGKSAQNRSFDSGPATDSAL